MEIPFELRVNVEKYIESIDSRTKLFHDAESISLKYLKNSGNGKRLVSTTGEAAAYSVVRMPATYGAVYSALKLSLDLIDVTPKTLLDAGAGTGAATWAAMSLLDLESAVCFEREEAMCFLGQKLMDGNFCQTRWVTGDILKDDVIEKADIVIASYVFNEMTDENRSKGLLKLWEAAQMMLLLVEPGTTAGYSVIKKARNLLIKNNAHIIAPCPHENPCPLEATDWCHFSCRIPRTHLHKEMKNGHVPYEDEKFSYIAVSRNPCNKADARILRHPYIGKGYIDVELCTNSGLVKKKIVKKDNILYKQVKKAKWGDLINNI